jgi:hypothetical protein
MNGRGGFGLLNPKTRFTSRPKAATRYVVLHE